MFEQVKLHRTQVDFSDLKLVVFFAVYKQK